MEAENARQPKGRNSLEEIFWLCWVCFTCWLYNIIIITRIILQTQLSKFLCLERDVNTQVLYSHIVYLCSRAKKRG